MSEFKQYRRKSISEMRPYIHGEILPETVSVSEADKQNGSPKVGDMIARNPKNHADQWLVAKQYFEDNLEPIPATDGEKQANYVHPDLPEQNLQTYCATCNKAIKLTATTPEICTCTPIFTQQPQAETVDLDNKIDDVFDLIDDKLQVCCYGNGKHKVDLYTNEARLLIKSIVQAAIAEDRKGIVVVKVPKMKDHYVFASEEEIMAWNGCVDSFKAKNPTIKFEE